MEESSKAETIERESPKLTTEGELWFSPTGPASVARQLSGAMLHHINNRLTAVGGHIQFAQIGLAGGGSTEVEQARKDLNESLKAVAEMNSLMKKIGKLGSACRDNTYHFSESSLHDLIEEAGRLMGEQEKPLEVEESDEGNLHVDKRKFSDALAGLFTNSLEAGASKVKVSTKKEGEEAVLEIADNGSGINLPKESLFNIDSSTKTINGGVQALSTGLFIAKTVVLACGGSIEVQNRKDLGENETGTKVTIRLPLPENSS